jgi:hypothetical protein
VAGASRVHGAAFRRARGPAHPGQHLAHHGHIRVLVYLRLPTLQRGLLLALQRPPLRALLIVWPVQRLDW